MASASWPPTGGESPYWGDPVATAASLPVSGSTGECRLVMDTGLVYRYTGAAWSAVTSQIQIDLDAAEDDITTLDNRADAVDLELISLDTRLDAAEGDITDLFANKEPNITKLPVAKGGTNSSAALNNNRIMRSTSGEIMEAAAITASRALISDANGIPTHHGTVSDTELGYLDGVTSAIQTQLGTKANVAGRVSGDAISAGDVGEVQTFNYDGSGTNTTVAADTPVNVMSFAVPAGVWIIHVDFSVFTFCESTTSGGIFSSLLLTNDADSILNRALTSITATGVDYGKMDTVHITHPVNVSGSTTYKIRLMSNSGSGDGTAGVLTNGAAWTGQSRVVSKVTIIRIA